MIPAQADNDQRTSFYDCIRGHIVTKAGSKVIWLALVRLFNPVSLVPVLMRALLQRSDAHLLPVLKPIFAHFASLA
jgi:hypothetical protein